LYKKNNVMLKNSTTTYGWLSIAFHWISALAIYGLFGLGLYMVDLSYDHEWNYLAPHWHESLGLLFLALLVARLIWRQINPKPQPLADSPFQTAVAKWAHWVLILLMLAIPITGYLISTAAGHDVKLFDWLDVPSITGKIGGMETLSGQFHYWLSVLIVALSVGHIAAAIKHHLLDKDNTLKRMLRPQQESTLQKEHHENLD
jgi:cytochrome b561